MWAERLGWGRASLAQNGARSKGLLRTSSIAISSWSPRRPRKSLWEAARGMEVEEEALDDAASSETHEGSDRTRWISMSRPM